MMTEPEPEGPAFDEVEHRLDQDVEGDTVLPVEED